MAWRFALWKIEAKLLALVLLKPLTSTLALSLGVAEFAGIGTFMWGASLATFFRILEIATAILFAAILYGNLSEREERRDEPLREPLDAWPGLESMARDMARQLQRPVPKSAAFSLSPVAWRCCGCDPMRARERGEITIPAGCLQIWPVMSLRCHIGHALVRRRPKAWLFYAVRRSLTGLERAAPAQLTIRPSALMAQPLMLRYFMLLVQWNALADIQADARMASLLGGSAVATWICQTQLAGEVAQQFLTRIVYLAAERGVVVPIAATFAVAYGSFEPGWLAMVEAGRVQGQRSQPGNPFLAPLLVRLAVLSGGPGSVHDPRLAATILPNLGELEERLLRREALLGDRPLRRASIGELADVLVPIMLEEVERNATALEGRSLADLPELVRNIPLLAEAYRPRPGYLLGLAQRKALVPGLLAAFLTVELQRRGWRANYTIPPGLIMERDGRTVCPYAVVASLGKGEISSEAFMELLNLNPQ